MGMELTNLTWEDMCDLMCGTPEDEFLEENNLDYMTKEEKIKELKSFTLPNHTNPNKYPWNRLGYFPKRTSGTIIGWQWFSDSSLMNIVDENIIDDALKLLE